MQVTRQIRLLARGIARARDDRGSVLVEFAIMLPILVLLALGAIDYGGAVNLSTKLNSAARAGAQYALYHPADTCGILNAVTGATSNSAMTVQMSTTTGALASVTAANCGATNPPTTAYYCTCGSSQVTKTNPNVDCVSVSCTSPAFKNFYVAVSVTETYTPTLIAASLPITHATGLPSGSGIAMTGSAAIQFQ